MLPTSDMQGKVLEQMPKKPPPKKALPCPGLTRKPQKARSRPVQYKQKDVPNYFNFQNFDYM